MSVILGIHGGSRATHGAGVCLLIDGKVEYLIEEERVNRYKHAHSCLPDESLKALSERYDGKIDKIAFPGLTYDDMKIRWPNYIEHRFDISAKEYIPVHHQVAHSANAYFCSPHRDSLVISLDGVGDQTSGMVGVWEGHECTELIKFTPQQSVGFYWHILSQYLGFEPLDEGWKVMGMAAYGEPKYDLSSMLTIENGVIHFNTKYHFNKYNFVSYCSLECLYTEELEKFLPFPPRKATGPLQQCHYDLAASMQKHLEDCLCGLFGYWVKETGKKNVCFGGGVALNSKANGVLASKLNIDSMYISQAPGDNGLALGAAYYACSENQKQRSNYTSNVTYNDPVFSSAIGDAGLKTVSNFTLEGVANILSKNSVIGLFRGSAEYGARALGKRSIIASPCDTKMKDIINSKIKYRESYRPFAPIVLDKWAHDFFEIGAGVYSHMSFCVKAKEITRKVAPAIVHQDGTSRIQILSKEDNEWLYWLILKFYDKTKVPILLNTSFNLKGEPIVETPRDAIRTFMGSGMDYLILGDYLISKNI